MAGPYIASMKFWESVYLPFFVSVYWFKKYKYHDSNDTIESAKIASLNL
jgi:hypothetical protein